MNYDNDLSFIYVNPTRVVFGNGVHRDVKLELRDAGGSKALIVTDAQLVDNTDIPRRVQDALGDACVGVFSDVPADSGVHVVDAGAQMAKELGADSVVSVGGGSPIDTAKGIAIVMTEGGSLRDYEGFQMLSRPQAPHVSIPTTAGTGSEVTYVAVIKDHEAKQKLLFGDHHIIPNVALLDPTLTVGLPKQLTAATGMDALSHAVEALHSQQREPIADALAIGAIRLIGQYLPTAVSSGDDLVARGQMLIAANIAGAAFSNSQVGLVHAMAHTVGAHYGVHHGLANSLLLPHVIRFNAEEVPECYRPVADAMGVDLSGRSDLEAAHAAADAIAKLAADVGLPSKLSEVGVPEDALDALAEATMYDGAIVYNARTVMEDAEVRAVYQAAF
jgi:alcohol dehydrogenase class IV